LVSGGGSITGFIFDLDGTLVDNMALHVEAFQGFVERHRLPALDQQARARFVPHTLRELGLLERLTRVVRSDEVPRGKPHPDVFLAAAAAIGRAPGECLAFEDAPMGVRAAKAAGMSVVALTTSFSAAGFLEHGAAFDHAAGDFEEYLAGPGRFLLG
jgi:beta-phosphoglucomutase-like phosphatase (HAD superfamily)